MIKRYGEPVHPHQRYTHRPGAYAILPRDGRVLITHQAEPEPEFQLPGGGIDPGEGPVAALHREVFEETGYVITRARRLGAYRRFAYMPEYDLWAEKIAHIYVAFPVRPLGPPSEPGHSAHWVTPQQALEILANEGDHDFLERYLKTVSVL